MPPSDTGAPAAAPAITAEPTIPAAPVEAAVPIPAPEPSATPAAAADTTAPSPAPADGAGAADPAKPALVPHTDTPTLLGEAGEKPADPAAEPAAEPAADSAADPVKAVETPGAEPAGDTPPVAEPVKYEPFTLPEGVTLDEGKLGDFIAILGNAELSPQDRAQQLVDMHTAAMKTYADQTIVDQHKAFGEMRAGWRIDVMADPELGGAGFETAKAAIARMRDMLVPPDRRDAFNEALAITGAGDHPEILRVFHRAARFFDEPHAAPTPQKPPPNIGKRPSGPAGWYDNPSSPGNKQG